MHRTRDMHLTVPYQVNTANWSHPKNTFDVSTAGPATSSCLDCVKPSYPSSEITSQCTEKCVVIACNNPDHGEISCHGPEANPHCDLVCDGTTNCHDCTGFDEFVSTLPLMHIFQPLLVYFSSSAVLTITRTFRSPGSPHHRVHQFRGILPSIPFYALVVNKGRVLPIRHIHQSILSPLYKRKTTTFRQQVTFCIPHHLRLLWRTRLWS